MSLTSTVTALATAETLEVRELPMPPWTFGAMAFGSFLLLLVVLWFFRNTASKYETSAAAGHGDRSPSHGSPGSPVSTNHGATDRGAHH